MVFPFQNRLIKFLIVQSYQDNSCFCHLVDNLVISFFFFLFRKLMAIFLYSRGCAFIKFNYALVFTLKLRLHFIRFCELKVLCF